MATFLLDVFCLGVKDVVFGVFATAEYRQRTRFAADGSFAALSAANARALVEGAVAYAQQFGLSPHHDYPVASRIFAGVDPRLGDRVFPYGKDGKPLYISGPRDTAAKSKRVLAALERVCGPDGYDFMVGIGSA